MSKTDSSHDSDRLDELEQRTEQHAETIEELQERLERRNQALATLRNWVSDPSMDRRDVLKAMAGAGLLAAGSGTAAAQSSTTDSFCAWGGNIDANGYNLLNLGAVEEGVAGNGNTIESLVGSGLSVNGQNELVAGEGGSAAWTDTDNDNLLETSADGIDVAVTNTEQADVTNETFVRATRGADSGSTTAGSFVNIYDGESKDVRGEFDESANAQFSPDESGEFDIQLYADVRGNTVAGDEIEFRVRNVTDSTPLNPTPKADAPGSNAIVGVCVTLSLDSAKTYEFRVTNKNSSFDVFGSPNTVGVIKRSVVA